MDTKTNDKMRKTAALMALAGNYESVMPKELLKIWIDLLNEYTADQVENGVNEVIKTYTFKTRPPYAVLREAIEKTSGIIRVEPEQEAENEAEDEFDNLLHCIVKYGRYKKPVLNPKTEKVLDKMGGWATACDWEEKILEWRRKDFVARWKRIQNEERLALFEGRKQEITNRPQSIAEIMGVAK